MLIEPLFSKSKLVTADTTFWLFSDEYDLAAKVALIKLVPLEESTPSKETISWVSSGNSKLPSEDVKVGSLSSSWKLELRSRITSAEFR